MIVTNIGVIIMKKISKWWNTRLKERTSFDGFVLIFAGFAYLLLGQTIAALIAYAAIIYGIFTFWKSE